MYSRLADRVSEDADLIGRKVEVVFADLSPEQKLPWFRLA